MTDNQTVRKKKKKKIKKTTRKRQFIAYAFFALLGWDIAILLLLQYWGSYCPSSELVLLLWVSGGACYHCSWAELGLPGFCVAAWVFPFEDPAVCNFARLLTVHPSSWTWFGKFQLKWFWVRLREKYDVQAKIFLETFYREALGLLDLGARPKQLAWAYPQVRAALLLLPSTCTIIHCRKYIYISVCQCVF